MTATSPAMPRMGTEALAPEADVQRTSLTTAVLKPWLRAQSVNVSRHAAALRPFRREEFGDGAAAPSEGHVQAVNTLMASLRSRLMTMARRVGSSAKTAIAEPSTSNLQDLVTCKEHAHSSVQAIEKIWDFYFELFGQRQGVYGDWLLSCDRIALDCYRTAYTGIGTARSVPAPPPFAYMRTGFSPATFRRAIPLRKLGRQLNPFPLVQLPYHRLVNPWTLGAVLHEISHNLQSDLGLGVDIPRRIGARLMRSGYSRAVAAVWVRWNREMFADMSALLLGGPGVVGSLMDVVGRGPETVLTYSPTGPHPTPYLRMLISTELLRRMGFEEHAEKYRRTWMRIYPDAGEGTIPQPLLDTFQNAHAEAVDEMCYRPYPSLGNKSLAQVLVFRPKEQQMVEEAARRLAAGTDPGIVPERFIIGAARFALDTQLARPGVITVNFYKELARR